MLVKDLDKGLVDFPTLFRGEEVTYAGRWTKRPSSIGMARTKASPGARRSTRIFWITTRARSPSRSAHNQSEKGRRLGHAGCPARAARHPALAAWSQGRHCGRERAVVVAPQKGPRYTLDELLAKCNLKAARSKEERKWLDDTPVGGELL